MKKIITMLCFLAMVDSAIAQKSFSVYQADGTESSGTAMQKPSNYDAMVMKMNPMSAKVANEYNIIVEQPTGTLHDNQLMSSDYYFPYSGYSFPMSSNILLGRYVVDDEGNIFIYNAIPGLPTDTWMKVEKGNGDTLVVKPQPIYYNSYYKTTMSVCKMNGTADESGQMSYEPDAKDSDMYFIYRNDTLTLVNDVDSVLLGVKYDDNNLWAGAGIKTSKYVKQTDETVTLDPSITPSTYVMKYLPGDTLACGKLVKVAFNGDDVYFGGFYLYMPDAYVKGKLENGKVTFKDNQYLGGDTYYGYHEYFKSVAWKTIHDEYIGDYYSLFEGENGLTFNYDSQNNILKADSGFVINGGKESLFYLYIFKAPELSPYTEVASTPMDPIIKYSMPYNDYMEKGSISFDLPVFDAKGRFLDTDKMYYNLYVDNETTPYIFTKEDYDYLSDNMTNVPYNYNPEGDFFVNNLTHTLYLYFSADRLGVQSVYAGGGEVNKSNIVYTSYSTDIVNHSAEKEIISYYDMLGRKISSPAHGINIVKYSDGTTNKIIIR
jgi:hypothetical protein